MILDTNRWCSKMHDRLFNVTYYVNVTDIGCSFRQENVCFSNRNGYSSRIRPNLMIR